MSGSWAMAVSVVAGSGLLGAVAAWLRADAAIKRMQAHAAWHTDQAPK